MPKATWGLWYWPLFILVVMVEFGTAEGLALATNVANTLSWFAWREFGFPQAHAGTLYTAAWYFSFAAYVVGVVFLALHIWFYKLRG